MANKKSTIYVFRDWVIGKGVQFFASFPEDEVRVVKPIPAFENKAAFKSYLRSEYPSHKVVFMFKRCNKFFA